METIDIDDIITPALNDNAATVEAPVAAGPTKRVEITLNFRTGEQMNAMVPVNKGKYTSLQSKSCTYKQSLLAGVVTKKFTAEQAKELWKTNVVDKWNDLVSSAYKQGFPQTVLNEVESIKPASGMLDFDVAE